ncbi:hypothetical protein Tco_1142752 [Tanacetum coccineum]
MPKKTTDTFYCSRVWELCDILSILSSTRPQFPDLEIFMSKNNAFHNHGIVEKGLPKPTSSIILHRFSDHVVVDLPSLTISGMFCALERPKGMRRYKGSLVRIASKKKNVTYRDRYPASSILDLYEVSESSALISSRMKSLPSNGVRVGEVVSTIGSKAKHSSNSGKSHGIRFTGSPKFFGNVFRMDSSSKHVQESIREAQLEVEIPKISRFQAKRSPICGVFLVYPNGYGKVVLALVCNWYINLGTFGGGRPWYYVRMHGPLSLGFNFLHRSSMKVEFEVHHMKQPASGGDAFNSPLGLATGVVGREPI